MAIAPIVTGGFGSFGSTSLVVTGGFTAASAITPVAAIALSAAAYGGTLSAAAYGGTLTATAVEPIAS